MPQARKKSNGAADIGSQIGSLTDQLTAIDNTINEDEAKLRELRQERASIARQVQAILSPLLNATGAPAASPRRGSSTGPRVDPEERKAQVLSIVQSHPEGVTAKAVADELGVASATATKAINELLESNQIVSQGERRSRRLLAA